jgi:DNA topoisomerase-1
MAQNLMVVESPNKIKKIKAILDSDWEVISTLGHIMDLDPKCMALDFDNDFAPSYKFYPEKKKVANNNAIKKLYKKGVKLFIASDDDREGDFIGKSIVDLLKPSEYFRITFTEITKKAILHAINNPTLIDYKKVQAQQVRRFMDRIFGYGTSPLLSRIPELQVGCNINKLGCGRVQNIITKIIIDKEAEIKEFYLTDHSTKYKGSGAFCITIDKESFILETNLYKNLKIFSLDKTIVNQEKIVDLFTCMVESNWSCSNIKKRRINKAPLAPYITSTLQCDSASKLNWAIKKTMMVSQRLYESGYITYMRTDSTILSEDALLMAEKQIKNMFGSEYHVKKQYTGNKESAQEAHEAIRPTSMDADTDTMDHDCQALYNLIWKRTMSSQMAKAEIESSQIFIELTNNNDYTMVGSKSRYIFKGYTILNDKSDEDINDIIIPDFGDDINVRNIIVKIKEFVENPPQRYNESQMVKHIEKLGIGRPATYVNMISKVQEKDYARSEDVEGKEKKLWEMTYHNINNSVILRENSVFIGKENSRLIPTELGIIVNDFLINNFPQIMNLNFTADLEKQLDEVVKGNISWLTVLHDFYNMLNPQIEQFKEKYSNIEKKDGNYMNNIVITNYLGNDIFYFKSKMGFCLKYRCCKQNKDIWVNVKKKPNIKDSIQLIEDKMNNAVTTSTSTLIKTIGKYDIKMKNESAFIQVTKGKSAKFYPIFNIDANEITVLQCKEIETKYKNKKSKAKK